VSEGGALGGWLFRHRGWLPVPLAVLCLVPTPNWHPAALLPLLTGEGIRLWAVGYIGRRSRTREGAVGALVDVGPYARLRNPLYVGNLLIWLGFGLVGWPVAVGILPILALHYHLIIGWEERQLAAQLGRPYQDYLRRVPRWWPTGAARSGTWQLGEALRSERGTFLVLATMAAAFGMRWYLPR
jgi:protein-S-isoprenylcysteine O-methyltransferase Ste14